MIRICLGAALLSMVLGIGSVDAKTLVFCSEGNPESLNPQLATTTTGMNAAQPVFDTLVQFKPGTTELIPALAERWEISPDGTQYTFFLRRGVQFHSNARFKPTRPLSADDVLLSFERQWKSDHPLHHPVGGSFDIFEDVGMFALLKSIDKVDDLTVRFTLTHAEAPFLADLAMPFAKILSAEFATAMLKAGTPDQVDLAPIGTGPFVFESYHKDMSIRYTRFNDHWAGRAPIDALVYSITPNPAVRLTKLKAGECQIMAFPSPGDSDKIERDPQLTLMRQEGSNVGYLALNATIPPFDKLDVRRAVNMAVDKATLVKAVYGHSGMPAKNPLPPTIWSYDGEITDYSYDPNQAQKLMAEAGLEKGFDTDLWYMPVSRPYAPDGKRIAEMIADDLARIGIRTHLVSAEWSEYRAKLQAGAAPLSLFGWTSDNGDPDNFLGILLGCRDGQPGNNNVAKWCNADYDALIAKAKLTADRATREGLYRHAQVIAHREAPWLPIAHSVVLMAARKNVRGFTIDPLGRFMFDTVDLEQE